MNLPELTSQIKAHPPTQQIVKELAKGAPKVTLSGLFGSAQNLLLSAIVGSLNRPTIIITGSLEEAEKTKDELKAFLAQENIYLFPAPDTLPYESILPSREITSERLRILDQLSRKEGMIIIFPVKAFLYKTLPKDKLEKVRIVISAKEELGLEQLKKRLVELKYKRTSMVEELGEFSVRGGIVDIFAFGSNFPVRLEYVGDEIESLRLFDVRAQRSLNKIKEITVLPTHESLEGGIFSYINPESLIVFDDLLEVENTVQRLLEEAEAIKKGEIVLGREVGENPYLDFAKARKSLERWPLIECSHFQIPQEGAQKVFSFTVEKPEIYAAKMEKLKGDIKSFAQRKYQTVLVSKQAERLKEILKDIGGLQAKVCTGDLNTGFVLKDPPLNLLTDKEIFAERPTKKVKPALAEGALSTLLVDLNTGDYVVHLNHGIGVYKGLKTLTIQGIEREYLLVHYAGEDKLYVPLDQMGLVQRYTGPGDYAPPIDHLGGTRWFRAKSRAKIAVKNLAEELLRLYAVRSREKGFSFGSDTLWQKELESSFPHQETLDQRKAIEETKDDMAAPRPMDRLICGDVGYGKTEVALRAAFKAVESGKQVAVLVPTTVLAQQHYSNFAQRLSPFPVVVEMLSRFRSAAEQKEIVRKLATGSVDIVIGTHRLIQKDVKFKDLGLVIIDEEQRFGVAHKEKLKQLRETVDVLTLTATPIPRTLYLGLSGARDMSRINTPPLDRSPIRTYVLEYNETVIKESILRELERSGQVYFVYNWVETIEKVAKKIQTLVPHGRIAVAHGQMREKELEKIMLKFMNCEIDVLVCTTIIESGIDIPNVNTIIIDHAERFGLAQLYQLRGRVGRSATRAYAYLLYYKGRVLTETALDRLRAIYDYTALGSGYKIALRDLEIRGAGNILGSEQHGHMVAVGFDLYCQMLEEAVKEGRGISLKPPPEITVDLKVDAYIPADYVADEKQRIVFYRRMSLARERKEVDDLKAEIEDRFGKIPPLLENLLKIIYLKLVAVSCGGLSLESYGDKVLLRIKGKHVYIDVRRLSAEELFKKVERKIKELSKKVEPEAERLGSRNRDV